MTDEKKKHKWIKGEVKDSKGSAESKEAPAAEVKNGFDRKKAMHNRYGSEK